jgi:hypothetical protein
MTHTAAFHAKMAQQRIRRNTGGPKEPVHLHQNRQHLRPECRLHPEQFMHHQVTVTDTKVTKQKLCHPCVCIYILRIPKLHFSIIMHMPIIASPMKIVCQICWVHYLLCGNTTDVDFEDNNSLLGDSGGADKS